MIIVYCFVAAMICVICAISNAINIPFTPIAWKFSLIAAVYCIIQGVLNIEPKKGEKK